MAEMLDVGDILEQAMSATIAHTPARIDEALRLAREAVDKQRALFAYATGYDPNETRRDLAIGREHLKAFAEGMFRQFDIEVVGRLHQGLVWDIRIPDALVNDLPGRRTHLRVTFDRTWGANRPDVQLLDIQSPLMQILLRRAKAHAFGGLASPIVGLGGAAVLTAVLRWQSDQGRRMRQEFTALRVAEAGPVEINPRAFADWLLVPAEDGGNLPEAEQVKPWFKAAETATDQRLAEVSNADLHPENRQWVSGGWCDGTAT